MSLQASRSSSLVELGMPLVQHRPAGAIRPLKRQAILARPDLASASIFGVSHQPSAAGRPVENHTAATRTPAVQMASGDDEKQAGSTHAYPVSLDSSLLSESNFEGGWELEPVAWDLGGGTPPEATATEAHTVGVYTGEGWAGGCGDELAAHGPASSTRHCAAAARCTDTPQPAA